MPPGDGGANRLWAVEVDTPSPRILVVKIRIDVDDDARAEGWALQRLGGEHSPRLIAVTTLRRARASAAHDGAWTQLRDLSVDGGGVVIMERMAGRPPPGSPADVSDKVTMAFARAVARLHQRRVRGSSTLPRLATGSSVAALAGTGRDLLDDVAAVCSTTTTRALGAQLERAWRAAVAHAEARHAGTRVRALCHGDLRFHNTIVDNDGDVCLVDFEHAGVGDPMVDLALLTTRTPLTPHQELVFLDAYGDAIGRRWRASFDRYFAVKPLCAFIGAVGGLLDLRDVARGERPVSDDGYVDRRRDATVDELAGLLRLPSARLEQAVRALTTTTTPKKKTTPNKKTEAATARRRQPIGVQAVAIDGTAGSGKSVIASAVATVLRLPYFNTGLAFRVAALWALEHGVSAHDPLAVARLVRRLRRLTVALTDDGGITVSRRRLDEALGVFEIDEVVSMLAAVPTIHAVVTSWIEPVLSARRGVCEGRDITTTWWPHLPHRFFLTADASERARRTAARLGRPVSVLRVTRLIDRRDHQDTSRGHHPMVIGDDVVIVDTTRLTEQRVVSTVLERIRTTR